MAPSRTAQKAEAKYGVSSDYTDLQLHSASANGNVGLVKYALMHGQPVNSVLNGVLPIHVAAAAGHELVVQMLIEAGADVNAPRLPRKYNTDRAKAISSIGVAGSTPLHFAAANGHANVATLLLSHGANPDAKEKHGLTPEDVAREHGQVNVTTVLRLWKQSDPTLPQNIGGQGQHASTSAVPMEGISRDRDDSDNTSIAPSVRSTRDQSTGGALLSLITSPQSRTGGGGNSSILGRDLRVTAAANAAAQASASAPVSPVPSSSGGATSSNFAKKLLSKPSTDSLSSLASKKKPFAKLASSGANLAGLLHSGSSSSALGNRMFPAPPPLALRQHPPIKVTNTSIGSPAQPPVVPGGSSATSSSASSHVVGRQGSSPLQATSPSSLRDHLQLSGGEHKSRRPSLPSMFDKATHPTLNIKSALGMTPASKEGKDHDPYNLGRKQRSGSKTSLSSVFRPNQHGRERSEPSSQPLSPAASSFFTDDYELEQADREAFLRGDRDVSSGEEPYMYQNPQVFQQYQLHPHQQQQLQQHVDDRQSQTQQQQQHYHQGRSRAGSNSSAATTGSGRSYGGARASGAPYNFASSSASMSGSITSGYPATAPPTQSSFFGQDTARLSPSATSFSTARPTLSPGSSSSANTNVVIPAPIPPPPSSSTQPFFSKAAISAAHNSASMSRPGFYRPRKSSHLSNSTSTASEPDPYSLSPDLSGQVGDSRRTRDRAMSPDDAYDPDDAMPLAGPSVVVRRPTIQELLSPAPQGSYRQSSTPTSPIRDLEHLPGVSQPADPATTAARHIRASSDGAGATALTSGPHNLQPPQHSRQRSQSHVVASSSAQNSVIPARRDTYENDPEAARESEDTFPTDQERPFPARSRAGSRARMDPSVVSHGIPPGPSDQDHAGWSAVSRQYRSGSTGTDTRTSRSGSTGEGTGLPPKFAGFEYSSSPASVSSFAYQPSHSTTATSLVSSPPGTAMSAAPLALGQLSGSLAQAHAEAQSLVKRKEEELLLYDPLRMRSSPHGLRQPSLSQQLAAYAESLSIERQLSDAERAHSQSEYSSQHAEAPTETKYSWEILGKETRTAMPVTKGERIKEPEIKPSPQQRLWTHKMVSPFEVPLPRPAPTAASAKALPSGPTPGPSGMTRQLTRIQEVPVPTKIVEPTPTQQPETTQTLAQIRDWRARQPSGSGGTYLERIIPPGGGSDVAAPRRHVSSDVAAPRRYVSASIASNGKGGSEVAAPRRGSTYLAPPGVSTSDLGAPRRPRRLQSASPSGRSQRGSFDKERTPSTSYTGATQPANGSDPTDSANSSSVSEPRAQMRLVDPPSQLSLHHVSKHKHTRSDPPVKAYSPEISGLVEETPRTSSQLSRLEPVVAPKFHVEPKAGGEAAPSPARQKFGGKLGKMFK